MAKIVFRADPGPKWFIRRGLRASPHDAHGRHA
jgi:hypothetical protein